MQLRIFLLAALLLPSFMGMSQDFLNQFELKVSMGTGYHGSFSILENSIGPVFFQNMKADDIPGLRNDKAVKNLPFMEENRRFLINELSSSFDFRKLFGDYRRSCIELRMYFNNKDFGKYGSLGLQFGKTHFYSRNQTLTSTDLILIQPNVYDSLFVDWGTDQDTILAIPRVRNLRYSIQMSSIDFGINYGLQLSGESNSKFRMFLGLGYRMRLLQNRATADVSYFDYSFKSIIYEGYRTSNPVTNETAIISLLNPEGRDERSFDLQIPRICCPSITLNMNVDWRLWYFPIYWGFQTELSVQHYRAAGNKLNTDHTVDIGIHLIYCPALIKDWRVQNTSTY